MKSNINTISQYSLHCFEQPVRNMNTDSNLVQKIVVLFTSNYKWTINSPIYLVQSTYFPANIRLDADVLKTSWRRLSPSSSKDIFKRSWSRPIYSSCPYVFKSSSRPFQDVLQKRLQNVFKTSRKYVLKTSSRRFEDVSSS